MITALTSSLLQTAYNIGQRIPEFYDQLGSARESIDTLIVPATIVDRPGAPELTVMRGGIHFERRCLRVRRTVQDGDAPAMSSKPSS